MLLRNIYNLQNLSIYSEITSFVIENDSFEYQRYSQMYVFYLGDDEHREIDPACTTWEAGYYYLYK